LSWQGTGSDSARAALSDLNNGIGWSGSQTSCELTVQAQDGYSYQIDEVKIFLNYFTDKSVYSENLVFEGSDDGVSWTTIIQYDENIHEGWNSNVYRDSASPPDYPYLRFVG
jgi:hypothetical protein